MTIPIQDEPESTIGRKPPHPAGRPASDREPTRSGAEIRREEGDKTELGEEIHERDRREPPPVQGVEE